MAATKKNAPAKAKKTPAKAAKAKKTPAKATKAKKTPAKATTKKTPAKATKAKKTPAKATTKKTPAKAAKATRPTSTTTTTATSSSNASVQTPEAAKAPGPVAVKPAAKQETREVAPVAPSALADLLAEVRRNPDDDHARLVYADALTERGDPRGTFISHHYQLADLDPLDERYAPLLASTLRLEGEHVGAWLDGYAAVAAVQPGDYAKVDVDRTANAVFERGFLRRIAVPPEHLAAAWAWASAREPIAGVELIVGEHIPDPYRQMPCARDFRALKVSPDGWFTAQSVGRVLGWGLPQLRDLDLSGCDLGASGAALLANQATDLGDYFDDWVAPPPFARGQLSRLILHASQIGDAGAQLLAKAETLDGITELDLGQCRLAQRETLEALRASPHLQALVRLSIAGNRDLAGQLDALAGWDVLARLAQLALPASVSAAEVAALYPAPSGRLRELDLSAARDALAQPAAVLACAEALTHLDLGTTSLGDASWSQLVREPCAARVIELRANGCSLSDAAIAALTRSPLQRLVRLDISSNKLTDAGLAELAAWDGLANVAWLRVGNNRKVTAAGYQALIASPHLSLAVLDVGKVSDTKAVAALRERFGAGVQATSR